MPVGDGVLYSPSKVLPYSVMSIAVYAESLSCAVFGPDSSGLPTLYYRLKVPYPPSEWTCSAFSR